MPNKKPKTFRLRDERERPYHQGPDFKRPAIDDIRRGIEVREQIERMDELQVTPKSDVIADGLRFMKRLARTHTNPQVRKATRELVRDIEKDRKARDNG